MGRHEDHLNRLTFSEWRRYRRLYRSMVISAGRARQPLNGPKRRQLKAMARESARRAGEQR